MNQRKELAIEVPAEMASMLPPDLFGGSSDVVHDFVSADEKWTLSLAKDFIALASRDYTRWEHFRELLEGPLAALRAEYNPAFFSRVGLRYRNIIYRTSLGLSPDDPWSELLQPYVLGFLQEHRICDNIRELVHQSLISNGHTEQVRIRQGLVRRKDSKELCFLIDADFFTDEKVECERAFEILDGFNVDAGQLFRWCIKERLHNALGPSPLAGSDK